MGVSGPSLLIESTDSMMYTYIIHVTVVLICVFALFCNIVECVYCGHPLNHSRVDVS